MHCFYLGPWLLTEIINNKNPRHPTLSTAMFNVVQCYRMSNFYTKLKINNCKIAIKKYCSAKIVLGIETSCDDTGCAVVDSTGKLLGETLYSQNAIHLKYGGVNPIFAAELHRENIDSAVKNALNNSSKSILDVDAVAVTVKPGLLPSLQVGVRYARYLGRKFHKPLVPVHHMEAHALVARMYYDIPFPFIVLLISGGHCLLAIAKDVNDFLLLGRGLDNSPGEVLDKVARRMKLKNIPTYSQMAGGKAIEYAAKNASKPELFHFPIPLLRTRDCNFSFSGLKDSLERKLFTKEREHNIMGDEIIPEVYDLCAAFQSAVAQHLVHRTERAIMFCENSNLIDKSNRNVVVSGGVACNKFIFSCIEYMGHRLGYKVYCPPPSVCTDNGIMIAWNGIEKIRKQCDIKTNIDFKEIDPEAPLGMDIRKLVQEANLAVKATGLKKKTFTSI